ncbi:KAP family P-loop NTPase fold protein [Aliarcobacter cryaerophilus]|uniref:KAP family P-loop NTPase fold protein n=1 Tax=Aliarcobacter cryaerophilus TaxID=28198 RepID=UPI003DA5D0D1
MWADNETTEDFLNYEVHCDLIKEYVTNPNLLPLTIGVFGDWGSGKSSIMKILEQKLEDDEKVLTIYFNSWLFESYQDAKISLLENILLELSKNETLGETAKKKILSLISRVDYMKLAKDGIKKYGKNVVDIIATGGVGSVIEAGFSMLKKEKIDELETADLSKLNEYIKDEQKNTSKNTIKTFRKDFEELINLTDYESVVIFIDDLDRCMPERVIETLEAIKLFLSVPNTAFLIGADERIIKHSISMHLKLHTLNSDSDYLQDSKQIVTDYIEKLIQIPYRLPKLSLSEIETYNNLLFCKTQLEEDDFKIVYYDYQSFKQSDFYSAYSYGHIKEKINFDDKPSLSSLLNLSHSMSQMITTILKGNPRQTKRFLNTFILRTKLASVAKIDIDIFVLIKLMLLEYFDTKLFKKLNELQSKNDGFFHEINILEKVFCDGEENPFKDSFQEWQTPQMVSWIKIEPKLSDTDLRNYFWLFRDKTESTLSDVHMVSPILQKIYKGLKSTQETEVRVSLERAKNLSYDELSEIFSLYENEINITPNLKELLNSLHQLTIQINNIDFYDRYLNIVIALPYQKVNNLIYLIDRLNNIKQKEGSLSDKVDKIIVNYSEKEKGLLKKAAIKYLEKGN